MNDNSKMRRPRASGADQAGGNGQAIDVHTHYVPNGWPDLGPGTPTLRVETEKDAVIMLGDREFRRIQSDSWDADTRREDMDADGVCAQVVSPTPVFFCYAAGPAQAARIARIMKRKAGFLDEQAREKILFRNGQAFLGMDAG